MTKKVDDLMSKSLKYVDAKTSLQVAHNEMATQSIRHLLIKDDAGKLVGLISDRDIKKYVSPFANAASATDRDKATLNIEVGKVMTKTLITGKAGDKVQTLAETMIQKRISAIPIVADDGKAIGIVTSTDMIRLLIGLL